MEPHSDQNQQACGEHHDCGDPFDEQMFSHIALSLSGGGIRAVGFHLGTLDILERLQLLENVHILSTVSGGSLVGTAYALSAQENGDQRFQKCFYNLYDFLPGLNTLEEILAGITGSQPAAPSGRRDLISGMANVFHEQFYARYYQSTHFGVFWEGQQNHLKEIMFNATEFRTGNAFRFQKSQFPCRIGNGNVWIDEAHARQMRMGDVMASSCCIPVGMEPLFFPNDFHWPDDERPGRPTCTAAGEYLRQERRDRESKSFVPLMDGGVYDNQGLSSVLLALLRRNKARQNDHETLAEEPSGAERWGGWMQQLLKATSNTSDGPERDDGLDLAHLRLFIVSDTPLRSEPFYPSDDGDIPQQRGGWLGRVTLGQVDALMWIVSALLLISVGDNLYEIFRAGSRFGASGLENFRQVMGVLIPTLTCGLIATALIRLRRTIRAGETDIESGLPPFRHSLWHYARKIRLGDAMQMLALRLGSVAALTTKVYLNRIRQLGYSTIFGAGSGPTSLARRIMTNEIYTLNDPDSQRKWLPQVSPGGHIDNIAEIAATMKTAVWIDPSVHYAGRRELDILVAAGQMACCYNLMRHIRERYGQGEEARLPEGSVALRYYKQVYALWREFEARPFDLVDQRKREVGLNV